MYLSDWDTFAPWDFTWYWDVCLTWVIDNGFSKIMKFNLVVRTLLLCALELCAEGLRDHISAGWFEGLFLIIWAWMWPVDGSGVRSRSVQLGQVGSAVPHCLCPGSQHAGPRVPVLRGSPLHPHFSVSLLGMHFYPSIIQLKYSYLVIFSCFYWHMLIFASSPTRFPCFLIHQR